MTGIDAPSLVERLCNCSAIRTRPNAAPRARTDGASAGNFAGRRELSPGDVCANTRREALVRSALDGAPPALTAGVQPGIARAGALEDVMAERTELGVLNHLLETCRDGERGFLFAAQHAVDPEVKELFSTLARERASFAGELVPHVHRLGGPANTEGSTAGAIHRGWMSLKEKIASHHDEVLLSEAERGERVAIHTYQEALDGMLPPTVSDLVERQHVAIREAYARIAALESAWQVGM
jgi:uncharacterized protein (TIGR02284 family)